MSKSKNKLFISYSHKDISLIDTVARRLEIEFGRNNIFYDTWSIQPGDSIIGEMNQGLEEFTTFFYFVSPSSLDSKMVSLEWQAALNRSINKELKFVAVRIADCKLPAILQNNLYIDLYGEGLDDAVEKMRQTVLGESVYKPLETIQNLKSRVNRINDNTVQVVVEALYYAENNPVIAFACENSLEEISICYNVSDGFTQQGTDQIRVENKWVLNSRNVSVQRAIKPGFPFVFQVYYDNTNFYKSVALFLLIDETKGQYEQIPIATSSVDGMSFL